MDSYRFDSILTRVRRNHAIEHATLSVLARKNPNYRLAGYSDPLGFWILGQVSCDELQTALDEAQSRLRGGEYGLAIHPNCGTNFATTGVLAGTAAWLAMLGSGRSTRAKLERLPLVMSLVTITMIFAQPLGPFLQARLTTDGHIGSQHVVEVRCYQRRGIPAYRIITRA